MDVEIIWSPQAEVSFGAIADDIADRYPEPFVQEFFQRFNKAISQISRFPTAFPSLPKYPEIRRCVIRPNVNIFFQIVPRNTVEIISVSQNRKGWGWRN
ncbi:MAG: type II toxin-antitoxin system RelE/ParE family toxin [Bacteroidota bacterium]